MVSGLEATADAIMWFEGAPGWKPFTATGTPVRSYTNRNPGNLRLEGRTADDRGYTIFPDLPTGYAALLRELQSKFSGNNSHGIGPSSTVLELFDIYAPPSDDNPTNAYAGFVADWVGRVLGKSITVNSPLSDIWTAS